MAGACTGGSDSDVIDGGSAADNIDGGTGNDIITGGADADVFVVDLSAGNNVVTDFVNGTDRIDLSVYGLGNRNEVIDLALLGGTGSILVENRSNSQVNNADLIL